MGYTSRNGGGAKKPLKIGLKSISLGLAADGCPARFFWSSQHRSEVRFSAPPEPRLNCEPAWKDHREHAVRGVQSATSHGDPAGKKGREKMAFGQKFFVRSGLIKRAAATCCPPDSSGAGNEVGAPHPWESSFESHSVRSRSVRPNTPPRQARRLSMDFILGSLTVLFIFYVTSKH